MNLFNSSSLIQGCIYYDNFERLFALCEICFWSATIFRSRAQKDVIRLAVCPSCFKRTITLIPVEPDKFYKSSIRSKTGLELKFSKSYNTSN
jgi:hypothetical protein